MEEADLDILKVEEKIAFGDKAYAFTEKTKWIMGNDDTWYAMD